MNMVPLNLAEEKKKFFFDPNYNPQFVYEQPIPDTVLYKYGPFGGELADKAKAICDAVIAKWGSESKYLEETRGRLLTREEVVIIIQEYLKKYHLDKKVSLHFSSNFIPRTHMDGYRMNIRLPVRYRENGISGMLHHEIGTHVFRRINDEKQVWFEQRNAYSLIPYLETEEGIAVLHAHLGLEEPYLWRDAIQYVASNVACRLSFSEVNRSLKHYINDQERRFEVVVKAKRGMTDTSKPGGFTKSQIYLRGVIKVLGWLRKNNFDMSKLYVGKIAVEDLEKLSDKAKSDELLIPEFILKEDYRKQLERIEKYNFLH